MSKFERIIRALYIAVAFATALAMYSCGGLSVEAAQAQPLQQYNEMTNIYDRLDKLDGHIDAQNIRMDDLSDKVSIMEGIGTGGIGLLGLLQGLIFVISKKHKEGA